MSGQGYGFDVGVNYNESSVSKTIQLNKSFPSNALLLLWEENNLENCNCQTQIMVKIQFYYLSTKVRWLVSSLAAE